MANNVVRADFTRRHDFQSVAKILITFIQRANVFPCLLLGKLQREEYRLSAVSGSVEHKLKSKRGLPMSGATRHQQQIAVIEPG